MKALVMGLGLNGGGLQAALYLASQGAEVRVTDLRERNALAPSIKALEDSGFHFEFTLGRHETGDFTNTDLVIKNPGVKRSSPYLEAARKAGIPVKSDIALFLEAAPEGTLIAVTGSKGKSSTSSLLHWALTQAKTQGLIHSEVRLGGNITVSPLSFLSQMQAGDITVLELSSWQLGDLDYIKPRIALITSIMADHQDYYGNMEDYVADKRRIYKWQTAEDATLIQDDSWGRSFAAETGGRPLFYTGETPAQLNRSAARLALEDLFTPLSYPPPLAPPARGGVSESLTWIDAALDSFPGIEHRMEAFAEDRGITYYNDSAATIPEAGAAAIRSLTARGQTLVLVTGGTDKALNFGPLAAAIRDAANEGLLGGLLLLPGTGTDKLKPLLTCAYTECQTCKGAAEAAVGMGRNQGCSAVVLSPGCASFGLFLNEFDRGRQWKESIKNAILGV
jgi:UDP-N-acetylmuramoylalanine--D-glutamate ligase